MPNYQLIPRYPLPDTPSSAQLSRYFVHGDWVYCCDISPDNKLIASGSEDDCLILWDRETGKIVGEIAPGTHVLGCQFHPDGQMIAVAVGGGWGGRTGIGLYDVKTGTLVQTMPGYSSAVNACKFTLDGKKILSTGWDEFVLVWDVATGEQLLAVSLLAEGEDMGGFLYSQLITGSLAIHPDGSRFCCGIKDQLKIFDLTTGNLLQTLSGHTSVVNCCEFSPDGKWIVSGAHDSTVRIWDAQTGDLLHTMTHDPGYPKCCAISPDSTWIATGGSDGTIRIWDLNTHTLRQTFWGHTALVYGCTISRDGAVIVSVSVDTSVRLWNAYDTSLQVPPVSLSKWIFDCAVSPDGKAAVTASTWHGPQVWDTSSGALLHTLTGHTEPVTGCAISTDNQRAITVAFDQTTRLWDIQTGELLQTLQTERENIPKSREGYEDKHLRCFVALDGRRIASAATMDCTLRVWDIDTGELFGTIQGEFKIREPKRFLSASDFGWIYGGSFTPDGKWIVYGSNSRQVIICGSRITRKLQGHTQPVYDCAVSADGTWIVSASADRTLKVWDFETGTERLTLVGHKQYVSACAISPDGSWIVSVSPDSTLRIWDSHTGECLSTFTAQAALFSCAIFPDGSTIVAGGELGLYWLQFADETASIVPA